MKSSYPPLLRSLRAGFIGLIGGLCALPAAYAQQVPDRLNYQGMLRKGDGTAEPAGYKEIEFRIYDVATGGSPLWARSHLVNLDTNGLFNVVLMEGGSPLGTARYTNLTQVFTDPGGEGRYLELTVAGSNPILPRQRFVSAAYAFLAADVTQARENFTVDGSLTVKSGAHVDSLTVDTASTLNTATFLGYVGIGTASPPEALSVNGNMQLGTMTTAYQHLTLGGGNSWGYLYGSYPPDGIHLGYNYYSDGSVGHVNNTGGQTSRLSLGYGNILFATAGINTPPVNRMILDENGRVGMGTTAPRAGLEIERGTNSVIPALRLSSSSLGHGSGLWLENRSTNSPYATNIWSIYASSPSDKGSLAIANERTAKTALLIATNLNIGIGASSPMRPLQIGDDTVVDSQGMMRFASRAPSGGSMRSFDIGLPETDPLKEGYSFVIDDVYTTGTTEFMVKWGSGNVGIGTNNPIAKLHVNGDIRLTTMRGFAHKDVEWYESTGELGYDNSSRRYKENIRPLEADWLSLLRAQPMTYTRPGTPGDWEIGFIAEDLDELGLKELVCYDEQGRPDSIHYRKIGLYLVEIAKAQQKELADNAARIEALEKNVEELRTMINSLAEKVEGKAP